IVKECGGPDVMFTEFVSTDGLCSVGKNRLLYDLKFMKNEKPIVAQVFGSNPNNFTKTAVLINKLGFDGIDINMGCPFKTIEKQGAGAALIKTPVLAQQIIAATKKGAGKMPVSVKTRIGYSRDSSKTWIPELLKMDLAAITIHGRTQKEKSKFPAHWDVIREISKMIKSLKSNTILIGNGDVKDLEDGLQKAKEFNVDGVMVGRAAMYDPWCFSGINKTEIASEMRLKMLIKHAFLFEKTFKEIKRFDSMKKYYSSYVTNFTDSKKLRIELMKAQNATDLKMIIDAF
ncbi:tRNA-dihydrouridine synthase, partial [Dolichospermum sp. ST_sed2]|nr:tRNA-dihydrouridine synthase [Dolichospermum sp. ST_sed2]